MHLLPCGHPRTEANLYQHPRGHEVCRTCEAERNHDRYVLNRDYRYHQRKHTRNRWATKTRRWTPEQRDAHNVRNRGYGSTYREGLRATSMGRSGFLCLPDA